MRHCIRRLWRRHRPAITEYLTIAVFTSVITVVVLLSYAYFPRAVAGVSGVPEEIVHDAFANNVGSVVLFGDYEKRHNFAQGAPTEFGTMSFDVEERLMGPPYYWTYEEVHKKGFLTGFSDPP